MRTLVIANVALLLLVLGCGSERASSGGNAPRGLTNAAAEGSGGSGGGAAGAGQAGSGTSFNSSGGVGGAGAGGIGAVHDPYLSTGGAGEPFEIACQLNGIDYAVGDAMPSIDGCNVCTCGTQGMECSDRPCRGQRSADGDSQDGDPYIECEDYDDCPVIDCDCIDEDGDLECDQHCPSYHCISGLCVNMGARPCTPEDTSECLENEFCDFSIDDACGTASRGSCSLIFDERRCTQDELPTCACNGARYRNACFARAAGQSAVLTNDCD